RGKENLGHSEYGPEKSKRGSYDYTSENPAWANCATDDGDGLSTDTARCGYGSVRVPWQRTPASAGLHFVDRPRLFDRAVSGHAVLQFAKRLHVQGQANWVVSHQSSLNITMVVGLGDI